MASHFDYDRSLQLFLLRKRASSAVDVRDVVQQVSRRLLELPPDSIRDMSQYVLDTARKAVIGFMPRETQFASAKQREAGSASSTEDAEGDVELARELAVAVNNLPELRRDILLLSIDGYSYSEIAERTGIAIAQVGRHIVQARAELADRLLHQGTGGRDEPSR